MVSSGSRSGNAGSDGLLRAGAARVPVTPPAGFEICGPEFAPVPSTGVDDDLLARVIVFDAEGRRVAICSLDVWGVSPALQTAIRKSVAEAASTHAPFVWVTCTGNGTSPPAWQDAPGLDRYRNYLSYLPELCGGAAVQASQSMKPAAIGVNAARLTGVTTGVSGAGAEADDAVTVASVATAGGDGIAQIFSFSCPAIVRGNDGRWTGDFPAYASWALEQAGGGTVAFARGSDADVRPYNWFRDNRSRSHMERAAPDVQAIGLLLATQASSAARQVEHRRNVSAETAADDDRGVRVLRVGELVCIGVDRPQPAIFARHLRKAMPRSRVIVSTNVAGTGPAAGEELDVDLELDTLQVARAAGAK
ncbi:MAG: hypothetical protein O3B04_02655 [Chloroflexi bacterium]|nr:hypothetical protein [Chloroflexota bacterium]